jgi:hypothetical protein
MDVKLAGSSITYRPDDDQLGGLSLEFAAFDGEVGIGQVPVPDPTAAISVLDGRAVRISEGSVRLTDGWIVDQDRERGPMPAATARLHTFSVQDANALLDGFRVARTRSSETDVARVLAFAAADGSAWDTTWVLVSSTVTLPAKTYDSDGGWSELISDVVESTGKTLFLHDKAAGGRCLHYHGLTSGHGCGLSISDQQRGGLAATVFAPIEPRRQRTSIDLRNDVLGRDQSGRTSTATDSTSISQHDADGLKHQSLQQFDAVSQADLDVKTAAFLASQKDERDTWTCQIGPLGETELGLIRVGDIITVTSSVMGLTASAQRIAHMTLQPATGEGGRVAEGLWFAALELGAPVRRRNRRGTNAIVIPTDEPWTCIPTDYTVSNIDGTANSYEISCKIQNLGLTCGSNVTGDHFLDYGYKMHLYAGATYRVGYSIQYSASANHLVAFLSNGIESSQAQFHAGSTCPSQIATDPPVNAVLSGTGLWSTVGYYPVDYVAPRTADYWVGLDSVFFSFCNSWDSWVVCQTHYLSGPDPRFESLPPCSNGAPRINQRVRYTDVTGDGTTTAFDTDWAYIPGSLHVWINGLDWTPEINEDDPGTGDYTLDYPVPLGATSIVEYRRAA